MYVCKKIRLATWLIQHGFNYIEEKEDKYNPKFKVWVFPASPEIHACIESYYHRDEFLNREK